jgi:hypothetical protein
MYGIVLLLAVALISLLVTRVATIALSVTGMARPLARFQARSALSGVGFTTSEAEAVVNHPVRRRIVMTLMLLGNVGLVTAVAGLMTSVLRTDTVGGGVTRGLVLVSGLTVVYVASKSEFVDRHLTRLIAAGLRRFTDLNIRDYDRLLHLSGEYSVTELPVGASEWLADRTLGELRLRDEGLLVLGVVRHDGTYIGVPDRSTSLGRDDTIILYGADGALADLDGRPGGSEGGRAHEHGVARHRGEVERESSGDVGHLSDDRHRHRGV